MTHLRTWALSGLIAVLVGCGQTRPLLAPPGPMRYQQNNANFHDPYPDQDAGPEVDGGRPREFSRPAAEPVRNRWFVDGLWGR